MDQRQLLAQMMAQRTSPGTAGTQRQVIESDPNLYGDPQAVLPPPPQGSGAPGQVGQTTVSPAQREALIQALMRRGLPRAAAAAQAERGLQSQGLSR